MRHALALADRAEREDDEIPVGAVLVSADGVVLGEGWNRNITEHDPTAHAEIVAMRQAGQAPGQPPPARLHAVRDAGALRDVRDGDGACARGPRGLRRQRSQDRRCGSVFDLLADPRHNHRVEVQGGVLADEAGTRLSNYFRGKRGKPPL